MWFRYENTPALSLMGRRRNRISDGTVAYLQKGTIRLIYILYHRKLEFPEN